MVAEAGIALLKLLLGLGVFAVLGYIGKRHDKRIAGVLLTFPILNGIRHPHRQRSSCCRGLIYAVVVFNGLLLFLMVWLCNALPPRDASPNVKLVARLIVWTAVWAIGAPLVIVWRDRLPGVLGLLLIQSCIAAAAILLFWKPDPQDERNAASDSAPPLPSHLQALIAFWSDRSGLLRLALFAVSFGILLFAAYAYEAKWVGMLSALPVPGLFAVATLSVIEKKEYFERMRDTVLFGPFSVIVFNWLYVQAVIRLPAAPFERAAIGIVAMLLLLFADAIFIFWSTPVLARLFSRAFAARRGP